MQYLSYLLLVLVLLVDLIFYVPLKIHIYLDKESIYFYLFSLPILSIDKKRNINLIKNKISLDQVLNTKKEDLKIIETIKVTNIYVAINVATANQYAPFLYPLLSLNYFTKRFNLKIKNKNKLYVTVKITIVNLLHEIIIIRRLKRNERTSN